MSGGDSFRIDSQSAIDRLIGSLTGYEKEVAASLRSAAFVGGRLLRDEMIRRAPVGSKPSRIRGKTYAPGLLRSSIYIAFSNEHSSETRKTFQIGPNKSKAGHWHWIEHGHYTTTDKRFKRVTKKSDAKTRATAMNPVKAKWVPAQPYIRPTWDAFGKLAVDRMKETMKARLAQRRGKQ